VNTLTGEGLAEVLEGAEVVVDVSNAPDWDDDAVMSFFQTSTRNLLAAASAADVGHIVALSVVGTERLQASGYFRAKLAQEALIKDSPLPYSLVHSTQFFEFLGGIAQSGTDADGRTVRLSPAFVQPISSDDVADAMHDVALGKPLGMTVEIGGPERIRMAELVQRFLVAKGDPRRVVADAQARYFGAEIDDGTLVTGDGARIGKVNFAEWFAGQA